MYQQQPFGNFYNRAINTVPNQNMVNTNFDSFNSNSFKQAAMNINTMDEHQIAMLVKNNIDEIVEDIMSGNIPYINIFTNHQFINGFTRAVSSIPINYKVRVACNKITYDYFTADNAVPEIKQKYLNVSRIVNRPEINKLITLGIDENTASNLAFCRYSSMNERTNVKRLNFVICNKDPNVMVEQNIVWIYEKLFDQISNLFCGVMFEVYTEQQIEDFGENFMEIYGAIGLAVIDIINNMTSDSMKKVLAAYYEEWEYKGRPPVRFSLRTLSGDYSHITRVVEMLDSIGKHLP